MPSCPKCGNNVDATMSFCPKCGTALNISTPSQGAPKGNVQGKQVTPKYAAEVEIQEKNDYGFVKYLVGGLILIVVGIFAILDLTGSISASGQDIAILLVLIGIIIIIGAIYVTTPLRKYLQHLINRPKKEPAKTQLQLL
jgi:hypothetical protein